MRILQSLYDAGGGVAPQLAVTRELVVRGHDVTVLAHPTLRGAIEERGASFAELRETLPGHDMRRPETDLVRDWEPADPLEGLARFRDLVLFGPAAANAREVADVLARHPADVVVLDWLLFGTALAAEHAGIPAVALVHCPYPLRTPTGPPDAFFADALAGLNATRGELGLPALDHWDGQLLATDAVLVLTSRDLDPAGGRELPANVRFTGPAFDPASERWSPPWERNGIPLVLASFSTTFMDQRDLAERTIEALSTLPVHGLVTTGPALDLSGVAIPDNVRVVEHAPHAAVLPHASLVVTHAGWGTVQTALAAGVPMLCVPTGRDQPGNAARVAEIGAGRALAPPPGVDALRAAISEMLAEPAYRDSASHWSDVLRRQNGVSETVAVVEALS